MENSLVQLFLENQRRRGGICRKRGKKNNRKGDLLSTLGGPWDAANKRKPDDGAGRA